MLHSREQRLAELLLGKRDEHPIDWRWLSRVAPGRADKKSANKFLLASILEYKMKAETVWDNAARLSEENLGDPEDLWEHIVSNFPDGVSLRKAFPWLHRFPVAYDRVIKIAKVIVTLYEGDARNVWEGRSAPGVLCRLTTIGAGEQISRMIVGALQDTNQIPEGRSDLKADTHVMRVLGRSIFGRKIDAKKAIETARRLCPEKPWRLDRALYSIGKDWCHSQDPACGSCYLRSDCAYRNPTCTSGDARGGAR